MLTRRQQGANGSDVKLQTAESAANRPSGPHVPCYSTGGKRLPFRHLLPTILKDTIKWHSHACPSPRVLPVQCCLVAAGLQLNSCVWRSAGAVIGCRGCSRSRHTGRRVVAATWATKERVVQLRVRGGQGCGWARVCSCCACEEMPPAFVNGHLLPSSSSTPGTHDSSATCPRHQSPRPSYCSGS